MYLPVRWAGVDVFGVDSLRFVLLVNLADALEQLFVLPWFCVNAAAAVSVPEAIPPTKMTSAFV